jgi:hypothetical protein
MIASAVRRSSAALHALLIKRLTPVAEGTRQAQQELRWIAEELDRRRTVQPAAAPLSAHNPPVERASALELLVRRREAGEPLQYVLGASPS